MWNWNNTFFLYALIITILSSVVNSKLSSSSAKMVKFLNTIVLNLSVGLSAFNVGIVVGQSSFGCLSKRSLVDRTIYAQLALLVVSLIMEGLLIAIVAHPEFASLSDDYRDVQTLLVVMLILNSLGIVGGGVFVALPHLR